MNQFFSHLPDLSKITVLVIGDMILDHYIRGTTERTSPEAPVPVVLVGEEQYIPGGAANVARNIIAAGAKPYCIGLIGKDKEGEHLVEVLGQYGISVSGLIHAEGYKTVTKTRVVSHGQQIVRLDRENSRPDGCREYEANIKAKIHSRLQSCQAVIVSDYAKGVIFKEMFQYLAKECAELGIPLFVDPKGRDYSRYIGATVLTPNAKEAREATGIGTDTVEGLVGASKAISEMAECGSVIITRGPLGFSLYSGREERLSTFPTAAREVFDVTGAGDTFVAWLAVCAAAGLEMVQAAKVANAAAGVVVGKQGVASVTPIELSQSLIPGRLGKKLITEEMLASLGERLRAADKTVVFTNGCFDFLHLGHLDFLQQARNLGDVLILAINSDEQVRKQKGAPRPIIPLEQRQALLASIEAVDYIVVFDNSTPEDLIRQLKPHKLVKGDNFSLAEVVGSDEILKYGGEICLLPVTYEIHTSDLIEKRK